MEEEIGWNIAELVLFREILATFVCNRKFIQDAICQSTERRITMNKEQQDRAMFVSFCIEQYAKAKGMTAEDVVKH